jgi:hypothetical protein
MPETKFKDRRIFERVPVKRSLRFLAPRSNQAGLAQTQDISAQGIGLIAEKELLPRTPLEIWLYMPDKGESVYTTGRVVWSKMVEPNKYRAGINLEKVDFMDISSVLRP